MSDGKPHPHRLPGLDGLRAVSIALVIGFHLTMSGSSPGWAASFFSKGDFGVDVFFTISGLLITWLLIREESAHGAISLKEFYARRALRILPPALTYLLVILVVSLVQGVMQWKPWLSAALFFRNMSMDDRLLPGAVDTSHFWSLSIEEQFYLFWPLIFLLLRRAWRAPVLAGLFLLAPLWREINRHAFHGANAVRIDMHCDGLLIGCLLACAMEDRRLRHLLTRPVFRSDWLALACLAFVVVSFTGKAAHLPGVVRILFPTLRAAAVALFIHRIIRGGRNFSALESILNLNVIVVVGQLSYSLYLWQQPFCMPSGALRMNSVVLNVLASCACAAGSFLLIERPALALRRKLPRLGGTNPHRAAQ